MKQNMSVKDDVKCQELLGLDYYLRVYNKMFIRDVCTLKTCEYCPEVFVYRTHPIYKVDVLGLVVRVEERDRCFIYALDDGTGVVTCCCWKPDLRGEDPRFSTLPQSLKLKLEEVKEDEEAAITGYTHGDLVHVKGKVKVFREVNEITALYHAKIENPTAETVRMLELPKLYKACYDKPFELPRRVQEDLDIVREETRTGVKSSKRIVQEVVVAVREHLRLSVSMKEFTVHQMCRLPAIATILNQQQPESATQSAVSMVTQALQTLEETQGLVCRRMEAKALYENLQSRCELDNTVSSILVRDSQKAKYAEKGCHYLHLLDELHRTVQYAKLHKSALLHCLQRLETNSDVIRTYQNQYLPCGT